MLVMDESLVKSGKSAESLTPPVGLRCQGKQLRRTCALGETGFPSIHAMRKKKAVYTCVTRNFSREANVRHIRNNPHTSN